MRFPVAVTIVALGSTARADDAAKRTGALTTLENLQHDLMDQAEIKLGASHVGWLGTCG